MFKLMYIFLSALNFLSAICTPGLAQTNEQITLTTYYPSPQGSYVELRSRRLALGDNYISPAAYCWAPAACANVINANADLVVEGNVGIGTIVPTAELHVYRTTGTPEIRTETPDLAGAADYHAKAGATEWGWGVTGANYANPLIRDEFFITDQGAAPGGRTRLVIDNTGKVGIGTLTPINALHIAGDNNNGSITTELISNNQFDNPALSGRRARGASLSAPQIVQNNDNLWEVFGLGYDGTSYQQSSRILMNVDGAPFAGVVPGRIEFATMSAGGVYGTSNLVIKNDGNIGLGTSTPGYKLTVAGTAWCASGSWEVVSDARLKKDIRPLENSLETILKLQGVSFKWIKPEKGQTDGLQRGFIAQDVEKVIPEWVKTDSNGYKSLEKVGVEALLVEAIKEQQQVIKEQQEEMKNVKAEIEVLKAKINLGK